LIEIQKRRLRKGATKKQAETAKDMCKGRGFESVPHEGKEGSLTKEESTAGETSEDRQRMRGFRERAFFKGESWVIRCEK